MYSLELITRAVNPTVSKNSARVAIYMYPVDENAGDDTIRFLNVGDADCSAAIDKLHKLTGQFSFSRDFGYGNIINAITTLPERTLNVVISDIEAEISNNPELKDRRRVVMFVTDGSNDGDDDSLKNAVKRLVAISPSSITMVAGGFINDLTSNNPQEFMDELTLLANGRPENAVSGDTARKLSNGIVDVLEKNGAVCPTRGELFFFLSTS